ncbi:hypothetical protein B0181_10120 [Moraxella caviae]|uniref:Uncharacterized protein n=1 Tax=Moraxella caviae TaxID=34060 RepID=A0A1S9ZW19_9GAMM|nr:hypothetical protein [Moraxella caviae]OOR87607.1 hypothetical protein B0181_10120 [Moraxella caviae]STZ13995.1 Uncharacterised protein [Moraxella caviae]
MIKVLDDGVQITLAGGESDSLFMWSIVMLMLAVATAVACFTLPVPYAIGAVACLAVLMYFFNAKKNAVKSARHHSAGVLTLKNRHININGAGMALSEQAQIIATAKTLTVSDRGISHQFSGFGDAREIDIAKQVLEGRAIAKREKAISLQSSTQNSDE